MESLIPLIIYISSMTNLNLSLGQQLSFPKMTNVAYFRMNDLDTLIFRSLKIMVTKNMVTVLPKVLPSNGVCKYCVLGNHHQEPFESRNVWHASNPLELVHNDLCYINKPYLEGVRYVLKFIDDLSRYT